MLKRNFQSTHTVYHFMQPPACFDFIQISSLGSAGFTYCFKLLFFNFYLASEVRDGVCVSLKKYILCLPKYYYVFVLTKSSLIPLISSCTWQTTHKNFPQPFCGLEQGNFCCWSQRNCSLSSLLSLHFWWKFIPWGNTFHPHEALQPLLGSGLPQKVPPFFSSPSEVSEVFSAHVFRGCVWWSHTQPPTWRTWV
jgi:hypothetical protein